ncbi:MAG: hypothetical protein ACRC37_07535 [Lentisphaeria bacterium]
MKKNKLLTFMLILITFYAGCIGVELIYRFVKKVVVEQIVVDGFLGFKSRDNFISSNLFWGENYLGDDNFPNTHLGRSRCFFAEIIVKMSENEFDSLVKKYHLTIEFDSKVVKFDYAFLEKDNLFIIPPIMFGFYDIGEQKLRILYYKGDRY